MKFSVKDFFSKWSNTLKQFVGNLPTNCLSVFDGFVKLALKGFRDCLDNPLIASPTTVTFKT